MATVIRTKYKPGTCLTPDKKRFFDEEMARKSAEKIECKRGTPMDVYACGKHFHLTTFRGRHQ